MKLIYLTKCKYCRLLMILTLLLFLGAGSTSAQRILWESGFPKASSETLGTYGDPVSVELKFSVADAPLNSPSIKITLPEGAIMSNITTEAGDTSGATYTGALSGQVYTITPNIPIAAGTIVNVKADIITESCNEADISLGVDVYSGATVIADAQRPVDLQVRKPAVRVLSPAPTQLATTLNEVKNFTLRLDVANGLKTKSLQVTLKKDGFTNLSNFKLDGTDITAKVTTTLTLVTIVLDEATLAAGGVLAGGAFKLLTFDASSGVGSSRIMEVSGQYPAEVACSQLATQTLTLTNPTISGTPTFILPDANRKWVLASNMDGPTLLPNTEIPMDGQTVSYLRLEYQNTGNAGSIQLKNTVQAYRSLMYAYAHIITDQIQYSIDGGTTKHTVAAGDIVVNRTLIEDNGYRLLKPGMAGLPNDVTITINNPVDAGGSIVIYWPIVQGDIYDNDTYRPTISAGTAPYSSVQFMNYIITATGANGEAAGVPSNTYGNGGLNMPKFMSSLSSQGMRSGEQEESQITLDLGGINNTDGQTVDLNIQIPSFLELDGTMENAIKMLGVDVGNRAIYTDMGNGLYRVRYIGYPTQPDPVTGNQVGTSINNLEIRYKVKAGACTGADQAGEIEYWMDYNLGGNTPIRPVLKEFAKLYQPVMLYCESHGIETKGFTFQRVTRGFKDSNENYVPDDGQLASNADIKNNVYLKNDEGIIILRGSMVDTYPNIYMLMTTDFKLRSNVLTIGQPTIKVGNQAEENINLNQYAGDSLFHIEYNKEIKRNQAFTIKIPFKTIEANNLSKAFDVELYAATAKQVNPFAPDSTQRVGTEKTGRTITVYREAFASDKSNQQFTNNTTVPLVTFPYFDSYHGNNFYTPYFNNEVRRLAKPVRYEFEIPPGYFLKSDMRVTNAQRRDQHMKDNPYQFLTPQKVKELENGNTLYSIDFASLFQNDVNTQAQADALPTDKWMHPDDIFNFQFAMDMQATKGAPTSAKVQATTYYLNTVEGDSLMTVKKEFNMNYNGDRTAINVAPNTIAAQEKTITIPIASISNPNTYATELWLYVEGDVENVAAKPVVSGGGGTKIPGTGLENRWVSLGTIAATSTPNYEITFDTKNPICAPDTVRVYSVSRFQDTGWVPDMTQPADASDIDHIAGYRTVFLTPTVATVEGTISTSSSSLVFNTNYTLAVSMDSKASKSALMKPQMVISVPAGQEYVQNSAKVEYPVGTIVAVPAAVETALIAALAESQTRGNTRSFTMKMIDLIGSDILHGTGDPTITDNDRIVKLTMDFSPMCETPLTGIRFDATLSGENMCGIIANGSEKHERSPEMLSTLNANYEFSVNSSMVSGNRAFNEIRVTDKLKVDIVKTVGTDALVSTDALYIYMPKYLDIADAANIAIASTNIPAVNGTKATLVSNTEKGGTRTVVLKLPVDEINAVSADHGLTKGLSYTIDLSYTSDRTDSYLVQNPEQTIRSVVATNKQFGSGCPEAPLSIGSASLGVALVTATANPYQGQVNQELTMEIISTGFDGEWYNAETGGTAVSTTAMYKYTPTTEDEVIFYVTSVFNGINYGRVPVKIAALPLLDFTVTNPAPLCKETEIDLSTLLSGFTQGLAFKYYSDAATQNEITNPRVIVTGNTSYFVKSTNGVATSAAKEIIIEALASTAITTQPVATNVNLNGNITLSVAATGENLTYQWKKDGTDISGATSATYTKADAVETDKGAYSVVVTGTCGSVTSSNAQVVVYPAADVTITPPSPICPTESIDLASLVTAKPGITVKFYSDAAVQNELPSSVVAPTQTTVYYVTGVNAGGVAGAPQPIEVQTNPVAEVSITSATSIVCANTEVDITVALTGTAPWTLVYSDGTKDYSITTSTSSHTFKVLVAKETTYTLKSVTDALGCGNGKINGMPATVRVESGVSIVVQPTATSYCEGTTLVLDVVAVGDVSEYQWYHNGNPVSGGIAAHLEVNDAGRGETGEYYVVITGECSSVTSNKIAVKSSLKDIIVQKWNNTLVANNNANTNGGYNFVSYKWFRDGALVDERPYHTVGDNPTNMLEMGTPYTLEVTTDKGEVYMTCPYFPALKNASAKLYPTLVNVNEPIYLEVETEDGSTPSGEIEIYNVSGMSFKSPKVLDRVTPITLPAATGVYVVKFKSAEIDQDFKVVVK